MLSISLSVQERANDDTLKAKPVIDLVLGRPSFAIKFIMRRKTNRDIFQVCKLLNGNYKR